MTDLDLDRLPAVPDANRDDQLWTALDWTLWGHGVGDILREHAADIMTTALPADVRTQLLELFDRWRARRGALPSQPYAELRQEQATASTQLRQAQADADRHLRNARHLGGLLERIANTLGADTLDLNELPALVDGYRAGYDQAAINAADNRSKAEDAEHSRKVATERLEARCGAYLLAYDHLAAVSRIFVDAVSSQPMHRDMGPLVDTMRDVLSRDLESYLAEPYDDITPDTRVDLTPAGRAITAAAPASCPSCLSTDPYRRNTSLIDGRSTCTNDWHNRTDDTQELPQGVASVPPVAREDDLARTDRALQTIGVVGDIVSVRLALLGTVDYPDGTTRLLAGMADDARRDRQHAEARQGLSWLDLLAESFWLAMVEEDPARLRPALVQVAAVAAAWAEAIDRRQVDEDEDLMTPGMPNPCQPIGCDNGIHLHGCTYAEIDEVQG